MNIQRAQEIAVSPVMVDVTYNGTPIYMSTRKMIQPEFILWINRKTSKASL